MSEDQIEVTEEELDAIADTAIAALQDILKYFNVGEVTIDEYEGDEGELILDITGDDLAILIRSMPCSLSFPPSLSARWASVILLLLTSRGIRAVNVRSSNPSRAPLPIKLQASIAA